METPKMKYCIGYLKGSMSGKKSPEIERQYFLDDIKRAQKNIKIAGYTPDVNNWGQEILGSLEKKIDENPEISIEIIVGPGLSNKKLEKLYSAGKITLTKTSSMPPCNSRLIDNCDTYTSARSDHKGSREYLRTFGNTPSIKESIKYFEKLKEQTV